MDIENPTPEEHFAQEHLEQEHLKQEHLEQENLVSSNNLNSSSTSISPEMDMQKIYEWDILEQSLEYILKKLKPLDLILFSGNSLVSKTIKFVEKEKIGLGTISHVGVVVTHEILPHIKELKKDKFYIWESTSKKQNAFHKNVKDIYGKNRFGVQIRELESVVKNYLDFQGRVFWGKINENPWKDSEKINSIILEMKTIEDIYGKSRFNLNLIDLAASIFPAFRPIRKLKKKLKFLIFRNKKRKPHTPPLFCSEFVAIIYKSVQILDEKIHPSDVVPVDFLGVNEYGIPRLIKKIIEFT